MCFTCGNPGVIWWKQEPSDHSSWGSGTVSPCASRLSAGSSGKSSSRGNPRTRCAQRQDLPTPTGRNKQRSAILVAGRVFGIAGVRFLRWRNRMKILFLLANWPVWGEKKDWFSNQYSCQKGASCHCYCIEHIRKILTILMQKENSLNLIFITLCKYKRYFVLKMC